MLASWCAFHVTLFEEMKKPVTSWGSDAGSILVTKLHIPKEELHPYGNQQLHCLTIPACKEELAWSISYPASSQVSH